MRKSPLILIGSAPSSGSTMFADLVDSTPYTACGPEFEWFCNRKVFDFSSFKEHPRAKSELFSLRSTSMFPRYERLEHFGLTKAEWFRMVDRSKDLNDLMDSFSRHFLLFRNKEDQGVVFEKTPQNVNVIDLFTSDKNYLFVYLVRDPLYVFNSLLNRGWGVYTSAVTWLIYTARAWNSLDESNVVTLKLEDIVRDPYGLTAGVLNDVLGQNKVTAESLKAGFEGNSYRDGASPKLTSWSVQDKVGVIRDPNAKAIDPKVKDLFLKTLDYRIAPEYASRYGLPRLSMREALERFGYTYNEGSKGEVFATNLQEKWRFIKKTGRGMIEGNGKASDYGLYSNVVELDR